MTNTEKPQGKPFIIDTCGFTPGEQIDCSALDIEENKILDWPMVYILSNTDEAYVGQTTSVQRRITQHGANKEKQDFKRVNIIFNEEFNMSVITDYESRLIQLMHADERFEITNKNDGISEADYFSKTIYDDMFKELWDELRNYDLVAHSIDELEDSEIFKYSPFKQLTIDQHVALEKIVQAIDSGRNAPIVVEGMPGSGKTILAVFLFKCLKDNPAYSDKNIKLVIPPTSLRKTLKEVFKHTVNLNPKDVIGPTELTKPQHGYRQGEKSFDILLVDESHRLHQRKNIMHYKAFDNVTRELGLTGEVDEVDWIINQCKLPIFFYDALQVVGPSGIPADLMQEKTDVLDKPIVLESQMRVKGGRGYIDYIAGILNNENPEKMTFDNYIFRQITSFDQFNDLFHTVQAEHNLTRMIAGYAWPWATKGGQPGYDIEIEGVQKRWNCCTENWVGKGFDSSEIADEVGCIHSIQGYDLSYAFVVLGKDIIFNAEKQRIEVVKDEYFDRNGRSGASPEELLQYIKNIYYVLLTRGIYGTYVYACDEGLRSYLDAFLDIA